jgi:hypothetical protein
MGGREAADQPLVLLLFPWVDVNYRSVTLGLSESGYAAVQTHLGSESTLTAMNQTFHTSTSKVVEFSFDPGSQPFFT